MKRLIKAHSNEGDIVMDFFAGSGTTGFVADYLNRQYILVEQLENTQKIIRDRFADKNYTYFELKKYNQDFLEKIQAASETGELLEIWEQMKEKSFLNYNVDIKEQEKHIEDFKNDTLKNQKQLLLKLLDLNQLYVNLSSLQDKEFECTQEEKKITNDFYKTTGK